MNIGFIGTGNMGAGIANNLIKAKHNLTIHDIALERANPLLEQGAQWADSPKKVAEASEITFTSLPAPIDMEMVAIGAGGVIEGSRPGTVYIDLTSNSVSLVRRAYDVFKAKGVHMLDAPVSGGVTGARSGKLAVMVGGEDSVYQRVKTVLDDFADNVVYCGDIGSGSVCKLMHNCILMATGQIISECFTLGVKAGVDIKPLWETVRRGAFGRGAGGIHQLPNSWFSGKFAPDWEKGFFAIKLARKDVGLATQLGRDFDVPMPAANLVEQQLVEALNRGWGDDPIGKLRLLQEEKAGVQLRADIQQGNTSIIIDE